MRKILLVDDDTTYTWSLQKYLQRRGYVVNTATALAEAREIIKILNIGRTSAYNLVKEGHFKIVRIGNAIRVSKKSFDEWLNAQAF
ncbi:MAG: helix-turn-helix domain-containing protein [Lachnospiraceae bacterium]|nr:helix-turn-helix domain-containing protein [Lachnospiraceae bacterium]